jgi:integrase
MRKNPRYREKTISQLLAMKNLKPMSLTRVNSMLGWISSFFRWAQKHGYAKTGVADGLSLPRRRSEHEERGIYTEADVIKIFQSPIFSSMKNTRADHFWIPLIALFSGMRLNEICQLYTEDVREIDGVPCFEINGKHDKNLKNLTSKRIIPIHPSLLEIGLLRYVEKMRRENMPRLWMAFKLRRDGYGHSFSNFWQGYNRKFITDDPKKVFHSFRHTLANDLKQKGVVDSIIAEILGHSVHSITLGRYGKKYQPLILLEGLQKISYKLDVARLKEIAETLLEGFIG